MTKHTIFVIEPKKPGEAGPFIHQEIECRMNMLISYVRGVNSAGGYPQLHFQYTGSHKSIRVMLAVTSPCCYAATKVKKVFEDLCEMGFFFGSITTLEESVAEEMMDDNSAKIALRPNTFPVNLQTIEYMQIPWDQMWKTNPKYFGEWK